MTAVVCDGLGLMSQLVETVWPSSPAEVKVEIEHDITIKRAIMFSTKPVEVIGIQHTGLQCMDKLGWTTILTHHPATIHRYPQRIVALSQGDSSTSFRDALKQCEPITEVIYKTKFLEPPFKREFKWSEVQ